MTAVAACRGEIWKLKDYVALTKPRLTAMVLASTAVGFMLGAAEVWDFALFGSALAANFMVASGAMALNNLIERESDAQMARTRSRALASGRLRPREALWLGLALSAAGLFLFAACVNVLAAFLACAASICYLLLYTPLKRKTSFAVLVGAVPGALPPLIGWASAAGTVSLQAWIIFLIVFFWQIPHFLAIGWTYRSDYERGGFGLLAGVDRGANVVGREMILCTLALIYVSLLPAAAGFVGPAYFFSAFMLGLGFAGVVFFAVPHLDSRSRHVLRASVAYLGILFLLMFLDRSVNPAGPVSWPA